MHIKKFACAILLTLSVSGAAAQDVPVEVVDAGDATGGAIFTVEPDIGVIDSIIDRLQACKDTNQSVEECLGLVAYPPKELIEDPGIYQLQMHDERSRGGLRGYSQYGPDVTIPPIVWPPKPCIYTPYGCVEPPVCRPWIPGCPPDWCPECGVMWAPQAQGRQAVPGRYGYFFEGTDPAIFPPHLLPYIRGVLDGARAVGE